MDGHRSDDDLDTNEATDPAKLARALRLSLDSPERIRAMADELGRNPRYRELVADPRALDSALESGEISQAEFDPLLYIQVDLIRRGRSRTRRKPQGSAMAEMVGGIGSHYARLFMWLAALVVFGLVGSWVVNWWNGVP